MNEVKRPCLRVLVLGDIVARPGREALSRQLKSLKQDKTIHFVVANGENAAGGLGLDRKCALEIRQAGVDVITLGDHVWKRKDIESVLADQECSCIRPGNFPDPAKGSGVVCVKTQDSQAVAVVNLIGRTFMGASLDCPFKKADLILKDLADKTDLIIVDFHAEATSEKLAMARHLDGRVSLLVGTHTHVQTADEQILPSGTGYITDLGMCGSSHGVIGMDSGTALHRFLTGRPAAYKPDLQPGILQGVIAEIDSDGKCQSIERVRS